MSTSKGLESGGEKLLVVAPMKEIVLLVVSPIREDICISGEELPLSCGWIGYCRWASVKFLWAIARIFTAFPQRPCNRVQKADVNQSEQWYVAHTILCTFPTVSKSDRSLSSSTLWTGVVRTWKTRQERSVKRSLNLMTLFQFGSERAH